MGNCNVSKKTEITLLEILSKIIVGTSLIVYITLISLEIKTVVCDEQENQGLQISFKPHNNTEWMIAAGFLVLGNVSGWSVDPEKIRDALLGREK